MTLGGLQRITNNEKNQNKNNEYKVAPAMWKTNTVNHFYFKWHSYIVPTCGKTQFFKALLKQGQSHADLLGRCNVP